MCHGKSMRAGKLESKGTEEQTIVFFSFSVKNGNIDRNWGNAFLTGEQVVCLTITLKTEEP